MHFDLEKLEIKNMLRNMQIDTPHEVQLYNNYQKINGKY